MVWTSEHVARVLEIASVKPKDCLSHQGYLRLVQLLLNGKKTIGCVSGTLAVITFTHFYRATICYQIPGTILFRGPTSSLPNFSRYHSLVPIAVAPRLIATNTVPHKSVQFTFLPAGAAKNDRQR